MNFVEDEDIVGKTIERALLTWDDSFIIKFTDGDILKIRARTIYDGVSLQFDDSLEDWEQRDIGLITEARYKEIQIEKENLRKQQNEIREKQKLEELKRKYEGKA